MYERFFGFRERPFDLTPNPRFLVMTEGHREALSNVEYAVAARKGITLLLGEAGCGKTTIIRAAIERQPARVHYVHISNPALTRDEFVETLGERFGLSTEACHSKARLVKELEALLRLRREQEETTVLVIDEAQSLSNELLEEIRLLANIETSNDKLLSLVLAGQPELAAQLDQDTLRQLKQRIALRCELKPLTMAETLTYLSGRIRAAGGVASRVFTRESATLLYEHSGGIPRSINVLADNALLAAFGKQARQVTSELVDTVARDFHLQRKDATSRLETATEPDTAVGDPLINSTSSAALRLPAAAPALLSVIHVPRTEPVPDSPETISANHGDTQSGTASVKRFFQFIGRRGTA
jgi:general secretion pathway protein A